jgi:hypothetical protein
MDAGHIECGPLGSKGEVMDKLEFFAKKNNLKLQLFAGDEYDIPGREGCIRVIDDQFGIELDDQTCIPGKAADGFTRIATFNPDDVLEVKLALEVIEVSGQRELTRKERKEKVKLLGRLRKSEILRLFAQKHRLRLRGNFIIGRAGRIRLTDGHLGVEVYDQACVVDEPAEDVRISTVFDPSDELQAKLALEVVETKGQKELTKDERKTKVELLTQLLMAEPTECHTR